MEVGIVKPEALFLLMHQKIKSALSVFLSVLFCSFHSFSQQPDRTVDSLTNLVITEKNDSLKLKAYMTLALYYYNQGDYKQALEQTKKARSFALSKGGLRRGVRLTYNIGMLYTNLSLYDSAMRYLEEAERMSIEENNNEMLFQTYNAMGSAANYQTNFTQALEYFYKGLELIEKPGNEALMQYLPQAYGNIGKNLIAEKQFDKGIEYLKRVLLLSGDPDQPRYNILAHIEIFNAYMESNRKEPAKLHLDTAIVLSNQLNNIQTATITANNEGYYYRETGDYEKAIPPMLRAATLCDSSGNEYLKADVYVNLSGTYLKLNKLPEAKKYALLAKDIALRISRQDILANAYAVLHQAAARTNDFTAAYQFALLQKLYHDSTTNEASRKTTLSLEARYQSAKKEKQIASLELSNTQKQLAVIKRNRLLLFGSAGAAALLLLMSLLYRNNRQKRIIAEKDKVLQSEQIRFLERQQQVVSLQSMINGQETERTRIAKDLHDGLGGLFSTIKMHFSTLQHEKAELKTEPLFTKSYDMIHTASEEVRRIAHNMMPEVLIKLGLVQATQELCNSISAGKLLTVSLQAYGMDKRLNASTEIMLFRIIQELLNNIIKHAHASEAIIQFNRDGNRLCVTVEDNGRGFNLQETDDKTHAGLSSVENRVAYLNGKLSIDSQKEVGTTVIMDFLINEQG